MRRAEPEENALADKIDVTVIYQSQSYLTFDECAHF
jgi:hypothetical protein